jgi:hypothetical protein
MQNDATNIRLQMLANGYSPLPNVDKICQLRGWPTVEIDEAIIQHWDRMEAYEATGARLDNGLTALDFDVDTLMVKDLYAKLLETFPSLERSVMRLGKGHKEAWFVRCEVPFSRIATATYAESEDAEEGFAVEAFGGESPRQFGAFGWHTKGELEYSWVNNASPINTPLEQLPVLTSRDVARIVRFCDDWLAERFVKVQGKMEETHATKVFDLTDDMIFVTREDGELTLDQLREVAGGGGYYYCSASFIDGPIAKNTRRCAVSLDRAGGVAIWDSRTDTTHHEARLGPESMKEMRRRVAEGLRALVSEPHRDQVVVDPQNIEVDFIRAANGNVKPGPVNVEVWLHDRHSDLIRILETNLHPWLMHDGNGIFPPLDGFPRAMRDTDDLLLLRAITRDLEEQIAKDFTKDHIRDGVMLFGMENLWNPLTDMLNALPEWDGQPRLDRWLLDYGGATVDENHSEAYIRAVSRKWVLANIARAYEPGCKSDHVLILKGGEGRMRLGKSSLLEALAGSFGPGADAVLFGDDMDKLGGYSDKDVKQWMAGLWIGEVAELTAIAKADAEHVKGLITNRYMRFRPSYGRKMETVKRVVNFAGTTNQMEFLTSSTGNRRFWPVLTNGRLNVEGFRAVRDQILAEAVAAYRAGEKWWFAYDTNPEDMDLFDDVLRAELAATKVDPAIGIYMQKLVQMEDDPADRNKCPRLIDIFKAVHPDATSVPPGEVHVLIRALEAAGWVKHPRSNARVSWYMRGPDAEDYQPPFVAPKEAAEKVAKLAEHTQKQRRSG